MQIFRLFVAHVANGDKRLAPGGNSFYLADTCAQVGTWTGNWTAYNRIRGITGGSEITSSEHCWWNVLKIVSSIHLSYLKHLRGDGFKEIFRNFRKHSFPRRRSDSFRGVFVFLNITDSLTVLNIYLRCNTQAVPAEFI